LAGGTVSGSRGLRRPLGRNDDRRCCALFLQAQKLGFMVLTANVREFDILLQLLPGRVLFYRRTS
jgi:hypothetical protein